MEDDDAWDDTYDQDWSSDGDPESDHDSGQAAGDLSTKNPVEDRYESSGMYNLLRVDKVRQAHLKNLLVLLREAVLQRDFSKAAAIIPILLKSQDLKDPDTVSAKFRHNTDTLEVVSAVLAAGYEVLRGRPEGSSGTQLKRYLRKAATYQPDHISIEGATFEQAYTFMELGQLQEAYDMVSTERTKFDKGLAKFHRAAYCGLLRHAMWIQCMRDSWAEVQEQAARRAGSRGGETISGGQGWDPSLLFRPDQQVWARGGRDLQDAWKDAEKHFKEALALHPHDTHLAFLLVQMYLAGSRPVLALETATQIRSAAPSDADAHALFLLANECTRSLDADGAEEMASAYVELLRCDPAADEAVEGLLRLHDRFGVDPVLLVTGLILHLDVTTSSLVESSAVLWKALAETLVSAADYAAHKIGQPAEGSAPQDSSQQEDEDPTGWAPLRQLLEERADWWGPLHFAPSGGNHQPSTFGQEDDAEMTVRDMTAGGVVEHRAAVAAFVLGPDNAFTRRIASALAGSETTAAEVVQQAIRLAGELKVGQASALGGSAEEEGQPRPTGMYDMVYKPTAFGQPSQEFGSYLQLPPAWWKSFPMKRRTASALGPSHAAAAPS